MKEYMPISDTLNDRVQECLGRLPFDNGEKVLGVLCRGTGYTNIRPYNHPIQPSLEAVFAYVDNYSRNTADIVCRLLFITLFQNSFQSPSVHAIIFTKQTRPLTERILYGTYQRYYPLLQRSSLY